MPRLSVPIAEGCSSPEQCQFTSGHVQTHADQLAAYLRERQHAVDRREARLNAQIALFETEARSGRLSLDEREAELAEREAACEVRQRDLEERLAVIASMEKVADDRRALARSEMGQLESARRDIQRREHILAEETQRLRQFQERNRLAATELDRRRGEVGAELRRGRSQIQEGEAKLAEAHAEVAQLQARLREAYGRWNDELRQTRQRLALEHREILADLNKKRDALATRGRYLDICEAKLRQLRKELTEVHRETLSDRLAVEQLWAQLSGTMPREVLAESLATVRSELSHCYQKAIADLSRERMELEDARRRLVQDAEQLAKRRDEIDTWAKTREEDLRLRAESLRSREAELAEREAAWNDSVHLREAERLTFQFQIGSLQRQIEFAGLDG